MTAQTPVYGLEYIVEGEPLRNARLALENNAKTIEAALVAGGIAPPTAPDLATLSGVVAALPRGRVASLTSTTAGPTGIAGTETVLDTVTFTAEANRRYKLNWSATWIARTALVTATFRVRSANGSGLTALGTQRRVRTVDAPVANAFIPIELPSGDITGLTAGQVTLGITVRRLFGTGTIEIAGASDNDRTLTVEDFGAV